MGKKKVTKTIGIIVGLALGLIISLISPPEGLTPEAMRAIGIIVCTIVFLSMEVFPNFITAILMCTAFVLFKCVEFTTAFEAFADTTFWLIVGVLGIGVGINKCGLLKRISYHALKLFPATFNGIVAALLGVGTICQPLMPSTSAKQSIVAPVAMMLGETLGFEKKSKQMAGLFNAMYVGWSITGTVFISASFMGYLFFGNLPADVQTQFTWTTWFLAMIPWAVVVVIGNYFTITRLYKPKEKKKITKDVIDRYIAELGPMSRDEKVVSVIMVIALILWVGENTFGISACVTSLLCLMAMAIFGIFTPADFNTKMGWGLIIFVGGVLNISGAMSALGISDWIGNMIEPVLGGFISNPWLFTIVMVLLIYLIRYLIPDMITIVILFTGVLSPLGQANGLSPWVIMMIAYCAVCIWVTKYQNANMLVGWAASGGEDQMNFKDVMPGAYAHLAVNLLALLVSIPYWQLLGYIS